MSDPLPFRAIRRLAQEGRRVRTVPRVETTPEPTRMDLIQALPMSVRRTYMKVINVLPGLVPGSGADCERLARENPLSEEEANEFRRYFPNGLFGAINPNPDKDGTGKETGDASGADHPVAAKGKGRGRKKAPKGARGRAKGS